MDSSESCHSSSSSLYYADADTLRAKLDEKNALLITAAQYGKDLLDQNRELSQSLEDLNRKYTRQIEILKEDNYSLTQRLEQKSRMEDEYQEEIESLKKHLSSQRDELKVLNDLKDQSTLIGDLRQRIRDVEATADRLEVENSQLKSLTTSQQEQIDESNTKIKTLQESVNDAASDEVSDLYRELNEATALSEELSRDCSHKDNQMQSLTQQLESHVQRIENLHEELNEANSQLSSISNSFMASTQENQELRCEIDLLRMNDRDHKKKGNSMFSELDDKRQEAEKKLLLLNVQYESVVNQYDLSKKQMNKLKLQMSNILRLASGQVDSNHVEVLESQLNEARNEIQTLSTKLTKISSDEAKREPQTLLQSSAGASGGGDHRTVQFVESLLKTKDEELRKVKRELEEKRLAVTYSGQELNDTQHRLRSLEGKVNQLHAQNIQLSVKVEELKTKYEDESTADTHLERGRVEDIPDYNPEIAQALLGSAARSTETLDSQKTQDTVDTAEDTVSVKEDTFSDNHPLEDIHNITEKTSDKKSVSCSPSKLSPRKAALQRPPGRYFSSENRSPLSSTDSLLDGGQVCYCTGECQIL